MSPVTTPARASSMLSTVAPEPTAWHGPSLPVERYRLPLPPAVLDEMAQALAELRRRPNGGPGF